MATIRKDDASWVRGMFGMAPNTITRRKVGLRMDTTASYKFADTSLGGNQGMNAPPQFTRFADIKADGFFADPKLRDPDQVDSWFENTNNSGSFCMGRFYSENIDDNGQYLHLRFGVPLYTGTIAFFANMYDPHIAKLAKTGNYNGFLRAVGKAVGLYAMFVIVPMHVLFPILALSQVLKFVLDKKPSKYYYLKPTMNLYLQAVQSMLDTQLLYHHLVPMWDIIGSSNRFTDVTEDKNALKATMTEVYSALPDIWKSNGKFDVYKMINRYHVLAGYQERILEEIYDNSTEKNLSANLKSYLNSARVRAVLRDAVSDNNMNLESLAGKYEKNPFYQTTDEEDAKEDAAWKTIQAKFDSEHGATANDVVSEQEQYQTTDQGKATKAGTADQDNESFWGGMINAWGDAKEQYASEIRDGAMWVSFKVNGRDSISDSMSNSTREPEISQTMNSLSSKARSFDFSTSNGQTGFSVVDTVIGGVKELLVGATESLHVTGLAAIFGASVVDIPDVWDSSEANIGTVSYTIQLRSPYGNDLSIFQNITVPLMFLLAGATPMATGKQTHTSPFICEAYSRGRQTVRLGIIDSISITRGVGNLGWRSDGKMLGCDVTINIKDLSRTLTMPIMKDPGIWDDDNKYTDYMATIGGASLHEMTYSADKLIMNVNKWKQSWKSYFMSGRVTNEFASWTISQVIGAFTPGTLLQ